MDVTIFNNHGAYSKFKSRHGLTNKNSQVSSHISVSLLIKRFKQIDLGAIEFEVVPDKPNFYYERAKKWLLNMVTLKQGQIAEINNKLQTQTAVEILMDAIVVKKRVKK